MTGISDTDWYLAGSDQEIPEGEGRAFELAGRTIAVFRAQDQFYAIDDQCPHMGASLAAGYVENCAVACPWHAWRFDIRDGAWCDNPRIKIDSFPVRVQDHQIWVQIPEKKSTVTTTPNAMLENAEPATDSNSIQSSHTTSVAGVNVRDFQQLIRKMYFEKDKARGVEGTFMWLMEEVGELSSALRERDRENQIEEFADVLAWLATIANVCDIDLSEAIQRKYGTGCPGCRQFACSCPDSEKP